MATIRKRGDTYQITVSCGRDSNGKQIIKYATFVPTETSPKKIEKEVQKFALDFEEKIHTGKYFSGDSITFNQFVEQWKNEYAKPHLSTRIYEDYESIIKRYFSELLGNMKLSKINVLHLQSIYTNMLTGNMKIGTIKRVHAVACSIFSHAFKWGIIPENICQRVELPKNTSREEMHCFNVEQTLVFLDILERPYLNGKNIPLQFIAFFNLAVYGGFRRGEMVALTWNDLDFSNGYVSITKSASKTKEGQIIKAPKTTSGIRKVMIPKQCISILKKWHIEQHKLALKFGTYWEGYTGNDFDNNFIFIQDNGKQMYVDTPTHKFKELIDYYNSSVTDENEKLPVIRLHDLRHTSATLLISQGTDIKTVSNRLGHSKTSITMDVYAHALKELDEKASDTIGSLLAKKA